VRLPVGIPSAQKKMINFFFKWPKIELNVKENPYEAPTFAYNREMDQLLEANIITNKVEEDFITCEDVKMTKSNDEE
jgi:hypothetical protein